MSKAADSSGISAATMATLMLSLFVVSVGYGILLPALPELIKRLDLLGGASSGVAAPTGLLTSLYTLSLFVFAPLWGRWSDRVGRRVVLAVGLVGFALSLSSYVWLRTETGLYVERAISGMFAAAIAPVALAAVGDLARTEEARGRRMTWVSLAGIAGFLIGPGLGALASQATSDRLSLVPPVGVPGLSLLAVAIAAGAVAIGVALFVPGRANLPPKQPGQQVRLPARLLLGLAFAVAAGVGLFEVALTLLGNGNRTLGTGGVAIMLTECSLVMLVVQAAAFSPWIKPETTRWFIAPALAVMAVALFLIPRISGLIPMLLAVGAFSASAGVASPVLTYWISRMAGGMQGRELGAQTAASSLGAAVGSAAGGVLFDFPGLPNAPFVITAVILGVAFLATLRLPAALSRRENPSSSLGSPASP